MEGDFGRYIRAVEERDVDLLLMEEFHVSPAFVSWFAAQIGMAKAEFDGAWHSVANTAGETDLLLRLIFEGRRTVILIENKVAAREQPLQGGRYHIRGKHVLEAGLADKYLTCICAPESYLKKLAPSSAYMKKISYESIMEWYSQFSDRRSLWRAHFMEYAIKYGKRGYVMTVDERKSIFHFEYWDYINRNHSQFIMRKPGNKGTGSTWIILKTHDMPKGVTIDHKNDRGCIDLTFHGVPLEVLSKIQSHWPEGIMPLRSGKSCVLRKVVPRLDMSRGVAEQADKLEQVLAAARCLAPYCKIMQPKPIF